MKTSKNYHLPKPVPADISTQWLTMREFCSLYRIGQKAVLAEVTRGTLFAVKIGVAWRIRNPGWEWGIAHRNMGWAMEKMYILTSDNVMELCGVGTSTLSEWIQKKKIHPKKISGSVGGVSGRRNYFRLYDVRKHLQRREAWFKRCKAVSPAVRWARERLAIPHPELNPDVDVPELGKIYVPLHGRPQRPHNGLSEKQRLALQKQRQDRLERSNKARQNQTSSPDPLEEFKTSD